MESTSPVTAEPGCAADDYLNDPWYIPESSNAGTVTDHDADNDFDGVWHKKTKGQTIWYELFQNAFQEAEAFFIWVCTDPLTSLAQAISAQVLKEVNLHVQ